MTNEGEYLNKESLKRVFISFSSNITNQYKRFKWTARGPFMLRGSHRDYGIIDITFIGKYMAKNAIKVEIFFSPKIGICIVDGGGRTIQRFPVRSGMTSSELDNIGKAIFGWVKGNIDIQLANLNIF